MAVDLSTTYMEIPMKNPIIIGAGPTTATPEICEKAAKVGGWAGVVLKTNYPDEVLRIVPLTVPRPYYAFMDARGVSQWKPVIPKKSGGHDRFGRLGKIQPGYSLTMSSIRYPVPIEERTGIGVYFQGAERFTYYVNKTKELVRETDCKVIASIAAFSEPGWAEQVKIVNGTEADMVELNFGCPTIGALDEEATGGEWVPGAMGFYPTIVAKWTKYCTERIGIPVGAKLPPYAPSQSVRAAVQNGAQGIQWGDAPVFLPEMSPLVIDVETATPGTFPGLPFSSGAIGAAGGLPYICGAIAHFRANNIKVDISGCGGVRDPLDIIRILMAGATSVQVCTATLVEGVEIGAHYLDGITSWMEKKGYESIGEVSGIAVTKEKLEQDLSKAPSVVLPQVVGGPVPEQQIVVNEKKCIACGWCERACFHLAIELEDEVPIVTDELCEVCGICVAVCPMKALTIAPRN